MLALLKRLLLGSERHYFNMSVRINSRDIVGVLSSDIIGEINA